LARLNSETAESPVVVKTKSSLLWHCHVVGLVGDELRP
jgi:hypothetical protein